MATRLMSLCRKRHPFTSASKMSMWEKWQFGKPLISRHVVRGLGPDTVSPLKHYYKNQPLFKMSSKFKHGPGGVNPLYSKKTSAIMEYFRRGYGVLCIFMGYSAIFLEHISCILKSISNTLIFPNTFIVFTLNEIPSFVAPDFLVECWLPPLAW